MAKKDLPFSGVEETAKQTDWSNTDWEHAPMPGAIGQSARDTKTMMFNN